MEIHTRGDSTSVSSRQVCLCGCVRGRPGALSATVDRWKGGGRGNKKGGGRGSWNWSGGRIKEEGEAEQQQRG